MDRLTACIPQTLQLATVAFVGFSVLYLELKRAAREKLQEDDSCDTMTVAPVQPRSTRPIPILLAESAPSLVIDQYLNPAFLKFVTR